MITSGTREVAHTHIFQLIDTYIRVCNIIYINIYIICILYVQYYSFNYFNDDGTKFENVKSFKKLTKYNTATSDRISIRNVNIL